MNGVFLSGAACPFPRREGNLFHLAGLWSELHRFNPELSGNDRECLIQ